METDAPAPVAPLVLVVMVVHDPGPWFEETLEAVASLEYANLGLLVVDAGSAEEQGERVLAVVPDARIVRLEANPGWGEALNRVRDRFGEAAFLVLSHDDVRPDPTAVRAMVEEAFRSNAGVVGPKLVDWRDPSRLLAVGTSVDKTGVPSPPVDRGELDQQQHDAVRDVFAIPGAFTLVRADLFEAIGGADPGIDYLGDDIDLCWRAHLAGARVLVAPQARVAHLEALGARRRVDDRRRLQARHRLRTTLVCYSRLHLARVLPQAMFFALVEVVYALVVGRVRQARDVAAAWPWNLRRLGQIRTRRKQLRRVRTVRDRELRRLQVRGSARLSAFLRGQIGSGDDRLTNLAGVGRQVASSLQEVGVRASVGVWIGLLVVLVVGSRSLLVDGVPVFGQFAPFPDSATELVREWGSGWRTIGLGAEQPAPTALGAFGLAGYLFLGATGLLRDVLVVGMLPLGVVGAWRLLRPCASPLARVAGLLVYASVPVGYNAVAQGHWAGLVAYGLAPFVVGHLARASGAAPWGDRGGSVGPGVPDRTVVQRALALGLLLAVGSLVAPALVPLSLVVAAGLLAGSLLAGAVGRPARLLLVAIAGATVATVLQLPWSASVVAAGWASAMGAEPVDGGGLGLGEVLRFQSGPLGGAPIGWAFLAVGAFALLVGRAWRLAWAVRGWAVALVCWGLLWAGERGSLPFELPQAEVLLAPAAVGLALAAAMGVVAFEVDLREYHFGWRQLAGIVSAVALAVGALPVLADAVVDGRWGAPARDHTTTLDVLGDDPGGFRILWVGEAALLPLASWPVAGEIALGTSQDGGPGVGDQWVGEQSPATSRLAGAVRDALAGDTNRLGARLGPMGVRYIVVPLQVAPDAGEPREPPAVLEAALEDQLDLSRVGLTGSLLIYENAAWVPLAAWVASEEPGDGLSEEPRVADGAIPPAGFTRFAGEVEDVATVYLGSQHSSRWRLEQEGRLTDARRGAGWANAWVLEEGGPVTISYDTDLVRRGMLALQVLAWLVVALLVIRARAASEAPVLSAAGPLEPEEARSRDPLEVGP